MADSKVQDNWDISYDGRRLQVRSHAKAADNLSQWTSVSTNYDRYDELVIVVFSELFLVRRIFRVPASDVALRAVNGRLRWASVREFQINPREFPAYEHLNSVFENKLAV
ncbi:MAG: hypothetical protein Q8S00_30625 [Deltaproteobacteria bacterium]|nr:hypothetical protein [Deltaproteobacteria bacterium]